ncbi:MAG: amidohydrolase family protein, partial [Phycisphaerales bacterium]
MPGSDRTTRLVLISAAGMAHAWGYEPHQVSVLIESSGGGNRVLAAGFPSEVASHPAASRAEVMNFERHVLLPGLVNAHTHLDLTHIGPRPHQQDQGFVGFVDLVRNLRATRDEEIEAAVNEGVRLCRAGGTVAVGDIAGAPLGVPGTAALRTAAASGLAGVGFLEFFAVGTRSQLGVERASAALESALACASGEYRIGIQPHATNTVSLNAYRWAAGLDVPVSTHLAESPEERAFIGAAAGPQRDLIERLG